MLVPNTTQDKMLNLYNNNPFKIVNTDQQQSVESFDRKHAGIVFYKKGTSKIKGGVSVDKPCVVLIEEKSNKLMFAISDPSHKLKTVDVAIHGRYTLDGSTFHNGSTQFSINLPQGENLGKTIQLELEKNLREK